jgi:hypothetical protein
MNRVEQMLGWQPNGHGVAKQGAGAIGSGSLELPPVRRKVYSMLCQALLQMIVAFNRRRRLSSIAGTPDLIFAGSTNSNSY